MNHYPVHCEGLRLPPNTDFTKYRESRRPTTTDDAPPDGPEPRAAPGVCTSHQLPACSNCDRLGKTPVACCTAGHHTVGYVDRRPMTYKCDKHGLGPCAGCQLTHRGVRHCCERGHHDRPGPHQQRTGSKRPRSPPPMPSTKKIRSRRFPSKMDKQAVRPPHTPVKSPTTKRMKSKRRTPLGAPSEAASTCANAGVEPSKARSLFGERVAHCHGRASTDVT